MNSVVPGTEFKRAWGKREGYVLLIKQLTSSQIILLSGKFNCVRKRYNYGPISFGSEPAKDTCTPICTKSGPTVQPTKSRLSSCIKPGYMWDPWALQVYCGKEHSWGHQLYWYIDIYRDQEETLQEESSFLSHLSHTFPFLFLPQSLPWRLKVKSRALHKGTGETDKCHRGPPMPVPPVEGEGRGTSVSPWRVGRFVMLPSAR